MRRLTEHSYLLRLWRDHAGVPLRATLIDVTRPAIRHQFANLDELLRFLLAHASLTPPCDREEVHRTPTCNRDLGPSSEG